GLCRRIQGLLHARPASHIRELATRVAFPGDPQEDAAGGCHHARSIDDAVRAPNDAVPFSRPPALTAALPAFALRAWRGLAVARFRDRDERRRKRLRSFNSETRPQRFVMR